MKKFFKWTVFTVIGVLLIIVVASFYVTIALPDVGKPENIKVVATPQRIARGKYLANHVTICVDCHSNRDWTKFAAPADTTALGGGGEHFDEGAGFPGDVHVPNITPYNLKGWTDGEIFRAITTGVKKDGSAIFPLMPWKSYSKMDREDLYSIIAYIRTLKPQTTEYPKAKLNFPLNILVHTMPEKATLGKLPDPKDTLKYGAYLVQSAACKDCHSQDNQGKAIPGLEFAGGRKFVVNGNAILSANITPEGTTGIGNWSRDAFVAKFRLFADRNKAAHVGKTDFQTVMPWWQYSGMTDGDLKAVYAYLRTLKPVKNQVNKFQPNALAANN